MWAIGKDASKPGKRMDQEQSYMDRVYGQYRPNTYGPNDLYHRFARSPAEGGDNIRGRQAKVLFDKLLEYKSGKVLDCACGAGKFAIWMTFQGMQAQGFDFSPAGIELARAQAKLSGLDGKIDFQVLDARKLSYASNSFDVITGMDCLHHLIKYPETMRELARVLKPMGKGFFIEPLGFNPVINIMRRVNVWLKGYEGEDVMKFEDMAVIEQAFGKLELNCHAVASAFSRIIAHDHAVKPLNPLQRWICSTLDRLDARLEKNKAYTRYSCVAFLELTKTHC